jgi:penicillin-binding protein 1C
MDARQTLFKKWIDKNPGDKKWALTMDMPILIEGSFPFIAPHATEYIIQNFDGDRGNYNSTIDPKYQKLVKEQLEAFVQQNKSSGVNNGAVLVLEYATGDVVSIIGSNDYFDDSIQGQVKGFSAKRSPGSTLKPFIYALALEQGIIHPNSMQKDSPQNFGVYTPDNYNSNFKGPVFAWQALVESRNIPAINLANSIKNPDLYDFLKLGNVSGIKERGHYGLSIVLGSAEVTMLELGSLYSLLPNSGEYRGLNFLKDSIKKAPKQLLTPESSFLAWEAIKRNPSPVAYRPQQVKNIPIAFKTGTSIGFKDSWSAGIFDDYVIVVWIGNFDGSGNPAFIGRKMAAPLLFSIADAIILEKQPEEKLARIETKVRRVPVCSVSGGIPNKYCTRTLMTGFIPGVSPITRCHIHREVYIDTRTGYRTDDSISRFTKKEIREFWPSDLLELFNKAGLPRLKPPPYPPENSSNFKNSGYPPRIRSPLDGGIYIIRKETTKHNSIILEASSDGDSEKLFWFANDTFLGSGTPTSQIVWSPQPGEFQITTVDDKGRSSSIHITVNRG